jgi:hypothetical protein
MHNLFNYEKHRLVNLHDRPEHNHADAATRTPNRRLLGRGAIDGDYFLSSNHFRNLAFKKPPSSLL